MTRWFVPCFQTDQSQSFARGRLTLHGLRQNEAIAFKLVALSSKIELAVTLCMCVCVHACVSACVYVHVCVSVCVCMSV